MTRSTSFTFLVLIIVALAGYLVYTRVLRPDAGTVTEVVTCTECGHVFVVSFPVGKGGAPYECRKCGAKSAYLAYQCTDPDCWLIFPVTPEDLEAGPAVACPDCGTRARRLLKVPPNADLLADPTRRDADND